MMAFENLSPILPSPSESPGDTAALGWTVCQKTASVCARRYAGSLRAVMITGSLARNEATWTPQPNGWELLGDAEFLLVFEPPASLPAQGAIASLEQEIRAELGCEGISGHVQLAPVNPSFLEELQPRIFGYELRACGRVVYGDRSVARLIPDMSPADIPLEDAWRLLANRMIENLEAAVQVERRAGALPPGLLYRTVKLYLDIATSLSVFADFYAPAYGERCRRLRALVAMPETRSDWPFPLQPFSELVSVATDLKLGGNPQQAANLGWEFWLQAVRYSRLLWQWELARLVGAQELEPNQDLMQRSMRLRPFSERLRGWIFVWRACGWLRSVRWWPRWARLAAGGSPRYCVYQAADMLFEQLPGALEDGGETNVDRAASERVLSGLPVVRWARRSGDWRWSDLVREVARNYHQFLEPTRA
ncbi:MAG TPA: hypothetical protein VIX19_02455 [Terriglobales bacterium]